MAEAIRRLEPVLGLSIERIPPLVVSFFVAELFFKFGSFGAECLAFLALWRGLDWAQEKLLRARASEREEGS